MPDLQRYDEFADLVRRHTSQVLAYINALLLNWNDADDLFQETCVVLWQKFDEFTPGTNFLAWALRIADFKVMKFRAKQAKHAAFIDRLRQNLIDDFASQGDSDAEAGLTALSDCMNRLQDDDRRLIMTCYGESVPVRQVANTMGRSPQSVHHSLCRVRKWLIECVDRKRRQANTVAMMPPGIVAPEDHR